MNVVETSDKEHAALIRQKLNENGGFCPCQITKSQDTKCMCKDFREQIKRGDPGMCHCGLYIAQK